MKKESIKLTPAQRQSIEQILSKGKALAWTLKHAQVLLKVDRGPRGQAGPPRKLWKPLTLFSLCCSLAVNSLRIPWVFSSSLARNEAGCVAYTHGDHDGEEVALLAQPRLPLETRSISILPTRDFSSCSSFTPIFFHSRNGRPR